MIVNLDKRRRVAKAVDAYMIVLFAQCITRLYACIEDSVHVDHAVVVAARYAAEI